METEWMKKVRKPRKVPRKVIPYTEFRSHAARKDFELRVRRGQGEADK